MFEYIKSLFKNKNSIYNKLNNYHMYSEANNFFKEYNHITHNEDIFKDFTTKLNTNYTINDDSVEQLIALITLAPAVHDNEFREFIYQKIIEELVYYCFVGKS